LRYHDPYPIGRLLALSESPHKIASLSVRFVAPTHSTLDSTLHILQGKAAGKAGKAAGKKGNLMSPKTKSPGQVAAAKTQAKVGVPN
jgi:hypothetical protein